MAEILIYGAKSNYFESKREFDKIIFTRSMKDAKKLLSSHEYALIIIDLESRENQGMELAEYTRRIPRQYMTPILFFSANRKMEWTAFHEIHCFDFFVKPIKNEDLMNILFLCMKRIARKNSKKEIVFKVGTDLYPIDIRDIEYLEVNGRNTIVHTFNSSLEVPYLNLTDFIQEYGDYFLQIKRSTAVNRANIRCISLGKMLMEMKSSTVLEIGRKYLPLVRKEFDENAYKKYTNKKRDAN